MKGLSRKQRLLAAALFVAGLLWGADRFLGRGQPATLQAAQTPSAPPSVVTPNGQDLAAFLARLSTGEYASVMDEIDRLPRDLFEPTAAMEAAVAPAETDPALTLGANAAAAGATVTDFQTRHKLEGIMLGRTPLAVVDGQVLALDADLDGYTLTEVLRDSVVFVDAATGARIVL